MIVHPSGEPPDAGDVDILSHVDGLDEENFSLDFDVDDFISSPHFPASFPVQTSTFEPSGPYGPTKLPSDVDEGIKPSFWFKQLWTSEMTERIVRQTNLYQAQKTADADTSAPTRPWQTLTTLKFEEYLSIRIVLGLIRPPSYTWAWADSEISGIDFCKKVMPLIEFEQITRFLHCANNSKDQPRGHPLHDSLYKVRPVLDDLRKNCMRTFRMEQKISIDEMDLAYQGQHQDKERITYKKAGDGFLVYSCNDAASAYTYDFRPKMCTKWNKNIAGFKPTFSAVLSLLESLEGRWHHVFVDNLYGNLKLAEECLKRKILWTSTMRSDRIPRTLQLSAKGPKGEVVFEKVGSVLVVKWRDRCEVKFATTAHLAVEKVTTIRRRPRNVDGRLQWQDVPEEVLNISKDYNDNMNGVDVADQLRVYYSTKLRSRKWWHTFFFWAFDTAICNAFICYKIWWKNAQMEGDHLSHADFRKALAYHLAKFRPGVSPLKAAREASALASRIGPQIKVKGHYPRALGRSERNGHYLYRACVRCLFITKQDRSWRSDAKRTMTRYECSECNVGLCVRCFASFHGQ